MMHCFLLLLLLHWYTNICRSASLFLYIAAKDMKNETKHHFCVRVCFGCFWKCKRNALKTWEVRRTWRNNNTQVRLTVVPSPSSHTFTFTKTKPNQNKTELFLVNPNPWLFPDRKRDRETKTETEWVPFASLFLLAASKRKNAECWFSKRKMRADQFEDTSKANPRANLSSLLFSSLHFSSLLFSSPPFS